MTPAEARALIAEGREHDEAIAGAYNEGEALVWLLTNLTRLLDGYTEALVENERLRTELTMARAAYESERAKEHDR